jgi:flagellar capping protein FliD
MAAFNKFNLFVDALSKKVHNLNTDVLKVMLTNVAPVATNAVKADITDITAGNGYAAGGPTTAQTLSNSSGTEKLVCTDQVITATGAIGPFRYAVLYNSTATNGELIGWWDYGSAVSLANTETFTVDFDGAAGVLTLA